MDCLYYTATEISTFSKWTFWNHGCEQAIKPNQNIYELLSEKTISETELLSYAKWTFGTMVVNKQLKPNQNIYELMLERVVCETE